MTVPFVHLQTHSEYSMLLGAARIKDLIAKAKEFGQTALALTDHGNMFGAVEFFVSCKKAGIKPIIGCEFFVAPDTRFNTNYSPGVTAWHKLIFLAKNQNGYKNLLQLCSLAYTEGFYNKPRIDWELIKKYHEGLFCLTLNHQGEIGSLLVSQRLVDAEMRLDVFADIFGKENVFLCVQKLGEAKENIVNQSFLNLHKKADWKLLAVNDIHYVNQGDGDAHSVLLCIEDGWKIDDEKRPQFPSHNFYLRSSEEMQQLFSMYPGALENSVEIAENCKIDIEFGKQYYPQCEIPPGFSDGDAYLSHLSEEGLKTRYSEITPELKNRLHYELEIMKKTNVAGYMLIVQDFIDAARKMGIPVGPGRGSAVGSLVSYCIGITDVDPIRYKLLFERFLNPERVSMPDIDTDFSDLDRDRIIQYVVKKYGKESVAQIVTYGRMKAKMVLRDVGRVMGMEASHLNFLCKLFPANNPFADLRAAIKESPELRDALDSDTQHKRLLEVGLKLEGFVRQAGMHAAAVIITPQAVVNFAPLFKQPGSDNVMIQYDKTYLDDLGLLKMDFLGLRNLSVIQDCLEMIRKEHHVTLNPLDLPEGDEKTLELLGKGLTVGVFQFESGGMQDYLRKLKPSNLEDIIAMSALYRPGPIEFIPQFIARKHGQEKIDCFHKDLEDILMETYGVIVYQEQVMQIAQKLSGFTLGGADLLRRAMSKKDVAKMDAMKPKFVNGAVERGYASSLAERIWEVLVPFSSYAFNKSHSAAYAFIAYQTAFLKAHYPASFMAANMTSEMQDTTRLVVLIQDCKNLKVEILFPNINVSTSKFRASGNQIVYGLGGVKNVGLSAVDKIVVERQKNGPYISIFDLCRRVDGHVLNRRALESLIFAGALDELDGNRAQQFATVEMAMDLAARRHEDRLLGQTSMFDMGDSKTSLEDGDPSLPDVEPWPYTEMLQKEKEVLGLFLSGHPLEPLRPEMEAFATSTLDPSRLESIQTDANVVFGGVITKIKTRISAKDNRTFAFAELEDFVGTVEVTFWSDTFEEVRHLVELDSMVLIRGKFQRDHERNRYKIIANKVLPLNEAREKLTKSIHLRLRTAGLQKENADNLFEICAANTGSCRLVIHMQNVKHPEVVILSDKTLVDSGKEFTDQVERLLGQGSVWLSSKSG